MPVISRGVPAFSSPGSAAPARFANDDDYVTMWVSGGYPSWIAYDLRGVPVAQRGSVWIAWYNDNFLYDKSPNGTGYNQPGDYTIDAHASIASRPPPDEDAGWVTLATVRGETLHSRSFLRDLAGRNWVRMRATRGYAFNDRGNNRLAINLDIHDAHLGAEDTWILVGDSITGGLNHDPNGFSLLQWRPAIQYSDSTKFVYTGAGPYDYFALIKPGTSAPSGSGPSGSGADTADGSARWKHVYTSKLSGNTAQAVNLELDNFPAYENAGMPFIAVRDGSAMVRLKAALTASPAHYVAVAYGMNDASNPQDDDSFYRGYAELLDAVLAAGRVPVVPTISDCTNTRSRAALGSPTGGSRFQLNVQLAKLRNDYRAAGKKVLDGPDLYTFFRSNPQLLNPNDVHPNAVGYKAMADLWAETMISIYERPATQAR